jgi:hypothetical protein
MSHLRNRQGNNSVSVLLQRKKQFKGSKQGVSDRYGDRNSTNMSLAEMIHHKVKPKANAEAVYNKYR